MGRILFTYSRRCCGRVDRVRIDFTSLRKVDDTTYVLTRTENGFFRTFSTVFSCTPVRRDSQVHGGRRTLDRGLHGAQVCPSPTVGRGAPPTVALAQGDGKSHERVGVMRVDGSAFGTGASDSVPASRPVVSVCGIQSPCHVCALIGRTPYRADAGTRRGSPVVGGKSVSSP